MASSVSNVEIRVTQRFSAPAERVFNAWVDPSIAGRWLFATATRPAERVRISARAGGSFRFVERRRRRRLAHAGRYIELSRPRRLVFTLAAERQARQTRVHVEIVPARRGCELTLVHERVRPDHAAQVEGRWAGMLYGLESLLESRESF